MINCEGICQIIFNHFVKVVCTLFVVSVIVDTASLSTGIDTDNENKGNIRKRY